MPEDTHYSRHIKKLQDKFGFSQPKLQVEGLPEKREPNVEDMSIQAEREKFKHMRLAVGHCEYKGKRLDLFYDVSKSRLG